MTKLFIQSPPPPPPVRDTLAELEKMHKQTLQRLDMLVDLQHMILEEVKKQAKETGLAQS